MAEPTLYCAITAVTSMTPARFKLGTGVADLPDSWLVGIPEVLASFGIPAYQPPPVSQFYRANYIADDEIEIANLDLSTLSLPLPSRLQFKPPLVELDGADFHLDVRKDEDPDSAALDSLSHFDGRIKFDVDLFQIIIRLTKAQVGALAWKSGWYTGTLTSASGEAVRVMAGSIEVV